MAAHLLFNSGSNESTLAPSSNGWTTIPLRSMNDTLVFYLKNITFYSTCDNFYFSYL
jgi:hypothetical protein